jgi:predicted O-methyltransferase YrrM
VSIIAEYEARLIDWSDIQGHMPFLRQMAAGYDKPVIIELGVRFGQSTSCFLAGLADNGGELWSVDVAQPQVPGHWYSLPNWHFLKTDGRGIDAQQWLPAKCDILFIDTDHTVEGTLTELRLHVQRVRGGGVVLMHDTELPSDTEPDRFYVTEALNTYCQETGLTWENRPGYYGLGVIRL